MSDNNYGSVRLHLTDGSVVTWEDSCILHERETVGLNFHPMVRVIVHSGNHVRASYRSDQVLSACRLDMPPTVEAVEPVDVHELVP